MGGKELPWLNVHMELFQPIVSEQKVGGGWMHRGNIDRV